MKNEIKIKMSENEQNNEEEINIFINKNSK